MVQKPWWRQAVDSVDEQVSRTLDPVVRNDNFAVAVGLLLRARRDTAAAVDRVTTAVLHAVNLPAKRDFDRVVRQVASLEREILSRSEEPGGSDAAHST